MSLDAYEKFNQLLNEYKKNPEFHFFQVYRDRLSDGISVKVDLLANNQIEKDFIQKATSLADRINASGRFVFYGIPRGATRNKSLTRS